MFPYKNGAKKHREKDGDKRDYKETKNKALKERERESKDRRAKYKERERERERET